MRVKRGWKGVVQDVGGGSALGAISALKPRWYGNLFDASPETYSLERASKQRLAHRPKLLFSPRRCSRGRAQCTRLCILLFLFFPLLLIRHFDARSNRAVLFWNRKPTTIDHWNTAFFVLLSLNERTLELFNVSVRFGGFKGLFIVMGLRVSL